MWGRSSTQRPSRHVVCFVVLVVGPLGVFGFCGTEVASGTVLFHVCLRRWALDRLPSGRRGSLSARLKTGARGLLLHGFVNETRRTAAPTAGEGATGSRLRRTDPLAVELIDILDSHEG